jgi:hypothetical protein
LLGYHKDYFLISVPEKWTKLGFCHSDFHNPQLLGPTIGTFFLSGTVRQRPHIGRTYKR